MPKQAKALWPGRPRGNRLEWAVKRRRFTMALDQETILAQIDYILSHVKQVTSTSKYSDLSDLDDHRGSEAATLLRSTIERLAPSDSSYVKNMASTTIYGGPQGLRTSISPLIGILEALRLSYANGYITSVYELVHADVFSDFLEMADHLLDRDYKDAAAVIAGSVLEEHLRKLSVKNRINVPKPDGSPKKADALNSELAAKGVYSKLDQKGVTAWLDLRNKAAHGYYSEYTKEQVSLMSQSVRNFVSRLPA
jgi:hypothetical protein